LRANLEIIIDIYATIITFDFSINMLSCDPLDIRLV